jgi:hypothetical protein
VLGAQRVPVSEAVGAADKKLVKRQDTHPLVRGKEKLLPSVTKVFREGQTLYVYAEAYDPETDAAQQKPSLAAALTVYRGGKLVYQSRPVVVTALKDARSHSAVISLEAPLKLPAGEYMAQLNVIDRLGQKAGFLRAPLVVAPAPGAGAGGE